MITKILLTALILIAALLLMRNKRQVERRAELQHQQQQRRMAMAIAIGLVSLTLLLSGGLYYGHWQERHQILGVTVINSHSGVQQHYQVYRSDLDGRSFRTIDGTVISLSVAERMEVQEEAGR